MHRGEDHIRWGFQFDFDMNPIAEFEIEQSGNSGFNGMAVDNDGNIYTLFCEYGIETTPGMYKDLYTLVGFSATGEELFRRPLGEDVAEDEYYYVNTILCNDENIVPPDIEDYTLIPYIPIKADFKNVIEDMRMYVPSNIYIKPKIRFAPIEHKHYTGAAFMLKIKQEVTSDSFEIEEVSE